jgi:ribosomal protein S18 acetylase RimI-like enzyme
VHRVEVSITPVPPADVGALEPLWNALREHHAAVAPELGPPRPREESWRRRRQEYETWVVQPGSFALVARRGGAPIGYAMVRIQEGPATWPLGERTGELETLAVLPGERGAGVGEALLEAVRNELRRLETTELSVHVVAANAAGVRFYERHGFKPFALALTATIKQ